MTFTTLTYLLFLPLVFALHWALRGRGARNALLLAASYVFYGWWDIRFAGLMLVSSLVDFGAGRGLERWSRPAARRALLFASCLANLSLLGFFKYFNFFTENLRAAAALLGVELGDVTLRVVLPVGISFYTFQTMSYTFDVYRGRLPATHDLLEFMTYVAFFPQLVAGPIERANHLLPQFQQPRRFDGAEAREGLRFMLWGFFKKLALADNLGRVVDAAYVSRAGAGADGPTLLLATFFFAFQIYCDFSAYSDIAVGTARLFGIRLMRNFAYPYFSRSVAEFWRRWHISLSGWFADYVYVGLGGSRVPRPRRASNVVVTFLLSGLWHGASWTFVVWGALNALAVLPSALWPGGDQRRATHVPGGETLWPGWRALLAMAATFTFVLASWVFFRSASLGQALVVLRQIAAGPWTAQAMRAAVEGKAWLLGLVGGLVALEWIQRRHWLPLRLPGWPRPLRWAAYTALLWCTLWLSPPTPGQFIYFQF